MARAVWLRGRRGRWIGVALLAFAVVATAALFGTGWYYADVLRDDGLRPGHAADSLDLVVVRAGEGTVTLRRGPGVDEDDDWAREGRFGLAWDGGYGRVGTIRSRTKDEVVRDFTSVEGTPAAGTNARIDSWAFPGDPRRGLGVDFSEVVIEGKLGPLPAWRTAGTRATWVLFVHGKDGERAQGLRVLRPLHAAGYPVLAISYRNDRGLARDPSGFHRYGATEWRDLEAAARYALDQGATGIVLVGYSMGGSIAVSFLLHSPLAESVRGAVLDAPLLDFGATVDFRGRKRGAPGVVVALGRWLASQRFDVDWAATDYLDRAGELHVPILLIHGQEDDDVPIATSEKLARLRPDLVTFVRVPSAAHVRAWNVDPAAYERALVEFLARVAP